MYQAADLKKGLRIELDGVPYLVTEFNFMKPGKGQAIYNCRLKNLFTGATIPRTFRVADKIDEPRLEHRKLAYSYKEGDHYVFTDENYEQVSIAAEALGDAQHFMLENIEVEVLYHNGRPIDVTLPNFVERKIVFTEPGVRGDTATNVTKPAKVEGGFELQVPLFVNEGDVIRIDTRTGEYMDRIRR